MVPQMQEPVRGAVMLTSRWGVGIRKLILELEAV